MLLKRFEAASVPEALAAVRRELGEDAVLLHTKTLPPAGLGRLFGRPRVEVLAALDGAVPHVVPPARAARAGAAQANPARLPAGLKEFDAGGTGALAGRKAAADHIRFPAPLQVFYHRLCEQDVSDATAQTFLRTLQRKGGKVTAAATTRLLADRLPVAPSRWDRAGRRALRIAFVGPTGAGKTTTMAKVAATAQLTHGRKIGLVTMDTYRIGAIPQLKVYADLLKSPLQVVTEPDEMDRALAALDSQDLVFIDTIGRSPLGSSVDKLVPFLDAAHADEVHLVLPATTRSVDLLGAAKGFARLRPNRLCFTKLDETSHYGGILSVSHATALPLTWLGIGQEVPDDLEEARPERIATAIVSGNAA
ncbi:MAG: hypothetical protein HY726_15090 [Candidatus Rokubacteria bacterium]|nr:hypothetical protein [Candidatus Rokubacteria bacterium]